MTRKESEYYKGEELLISRAGFPPLRERQEGVAEKTKREAVMNG